MREYRLRRWMKVLVSSLGLNAANWHYIKVDDKQLTIIYKHTFHTKTIQRK